MIKRTTLLFLLLLFAFSTSGCFWGILGGNGINVVVKNQTDDEIQVEAGGNLTGDSGWAFPGKFDVKSGDEVILNIDGWEINPQVKAQYKGQIKIYRVHPDFFGNDTVNVKKSDFPGTNG